MAPRAFGPEVCPHQRIVADAHTPVRRSAQPFLSGISRWRAECLCLGPSTALVRRRIGRTGGSGLRGARGGRSPSAGAWNAGSGEVGKLLLLICCDREQLQIGQGGAMTSKAPPISDLCLADSAAPRGAKQYHPSIKTIYNNIKTYTFRATKHSQLNHVSEV